MKPPGASFAPGLEEAHPPPPPGPMSQQDMDDEQHPPEISGIDKRRTGGKIIVLLTSGIFFLYAIRIDMPFVILAITDPDYSDSQTVENATWDQMTRGLILSAFFWGYVPAQVITGLVLHWRSGLSANDGFWVSGSTLASGILALLTPVAVYYGDWTSVCIVRGIMGIFQGVALPVIYRIFMIVIVKKERQSVDGIVHVEVLLAAAVTFYFCSVVVPTSVGWSLVFYIFGSFVVVWSVAELFLIRRQDLAKFSPPPGSPRFSQPPPPWKRILGCGGFWALLATNVTQTWCFWLLITQTPLYLQAILSYDDLSLNGRALGLFYFFSLAFVAVVACLSWCTQQAKSCVCAVPLGVTRKVWNSVGSWIPAVCLLVLGILPDAEAPLPFFLLLFTVTFNAVVVLGYQRNPTDLSPKFAETIATITNVTANLVAATAPIIAAALVTDPTSATQWGCLFYITGAVYFTGNLLFVIFGSGVRQTWDKPIGEFPAGSPEVDSRVQ